MPSGRPARSGLILARRVVRNSRISLRTSFPVVTSPRLRRLTAGGSPCQCRAAAALRLAVSADPDFGLAVADLAALTGTPDHQLAGRVMNWERHHIEVVATAAAGQATRAADLLREHLASVGCDPLAVRITARLQPPTGPGDDFEDLAGQLPSCRHPMVERPMTL